MSYLERKLAVLVDQNYVEIQYQRRSGINISEGGEVSARGICSQSFYGDVTLPWLPRSPAFNDYYLEEWLPPRREWSGRLQRQNMTERDVYYDNSAMQQRQRQEAYFDYSGLASSVKPVLHQEHWRPIMFPLTTVVTNPSESGALPSPGGGGRAGSPARGITPPAAAARHAGLDEVPHLD